MHAAGVLALAFVLLAGWSGLGLARSLVLGGLTVLITFAAQRSVKRLGAEGCSSGMASSGTGRRAAPGANCGWGWTCSARCSSNCVPRLTGHPAHGLAVA
ncbi:MAG: hypothetical protein HZY78_10460 [Burkholderiaceae bacterium]|nr:MAG: hypothetical protein HZY78_10460 [Burkholderiaceae bacterium]